MLIYAAKSPVNLRALNKQLKAKTEKLFAFGRRELEGTADLDLQNARGDWTMDTPYIREGDLKDLAAKATTTVDEVTKLLQSAVPKSLHGRVKTDTKAFFAKFDVVKASKDWNLADVFRGYSTTSGTKLKKSDKLYAVDPIWGWWMEKGGLADTVRDASSVLKRLKKDIIQAEAVAEAAAKAKAFDDQEKAEAAAKAKEDRELAKARKNEEKAKAKAKAKVEGKKREHDAAWAGLYYAPAKALAALPAKLEKVRASETDYEVDGKKGKAFGYGPVSSMTYLVEEIQRFNLHPVTRMAKAAKLPSAKLLAKHNKAINEIKKLNGSAPGVNAYNNAWTSGEVEGAHKKIEDVLKALDRDAKVAWQEYQDHLKQQQAADAKTASRVATRFLQSLA